MCGEVPPPNFSISFIISVFPLRSCRFAVIRARLFSFVIALSTLCLIFAPVPPFSVSLLSGGGIVSPSGT